jgi:adenine deaminase
VEVLTLRHRIDVAAGRTPADIKLTGGRVVSVFSGSIIKIDVAIADGVLVGFGYYRARRTIDLRGGYLSAGLIDSHIHLESSLLSPQEFARAVVPRGTTAVIADPHEIANVMGSRGIRWMLSASEGLPLDIYFGLPSCVPATRMETSGAKLDAKSLRKFVDHPRIVAVGEVMDYPDVILGRRDLLEKIRLKRGLRVDGHAPGVTGKDLNAYIVAGIYSDHESTRASEAKEKLDKGMHVMIREGTTEKDLKELAKIVTPANAHRCMFCCDDCSASDILEHGYMDYILRKAVRSGLKPITALQIASENTAHYYRFARRTGAVAIGYRADLVVFEDLKNFKAKMVFKDGRLVARDGELIVPCKPKRKLGMLNTMRVKRFDKNSFSVRANKARIRVIEAVPKQIITKERHVKAFVRNSFITSDTKNDILKLAVVERHKRSGNIGLGFVMGFGLKRGAIASSVAHDSHNIICVGVSDDDIFRAAKALVDHRGGLVVVDGGNVMASLPLPIAGLMTDAPASVVANQLDALNAAAHSIGCKLKDPFLQLSFLALPVIPSLKLTDRGLVDVTSFKKVSLFV